MRFEPRLRSWIGILVIGALALSCNEDPVSPDTTAPGAVTDLHVTHVSVNSLYLRWTAPGDDGGTGRATQYDIRFATGAIDAGNFETADAVPGLQPPASAAAPESLLVTGLAQSQAYSFALRTADEIPNWSELSNVATLTTLDGTAPAAVSDLAVTSSGFRTAILSWTAPGDDGSVGTAMLYDVRHATSPITDSNWNDAIPVGSVPAPAVAGTPETLTVNDLEPSAELWFAVRATDDAGNLGSLSNIVAANVSEPRSGDELLEKLKIAYRERDYATYQEVFTNPADDAPYYFFLNAPVNGITSWDATEELRIHRRMFNPEDPLPGEPPVSVDLWPVTISIELTRTASAWVERTDLYRSPGNPEGLDSAKWKASEAEFHADVLWELQGDTDYRIDGRQNFIVIEDLTKAPGEERKYLIYRWEDLDPPPSAVSFEPATWGMVKGLYQ